MRTLLVLLALIALNGCATNFEPKPLPPDHPASVQAQEAPRVGMKRLVSSDELTRKTKAELARNAAPAPDFQGSGMSHDLSSMPGMNMSKPSPGAPSPQPGAMPGMDHSKMKDMAAPTPAAAPANKEAVEMEMKKTSDEMKKTSDELKARSDEAKRAKQAGSKAPKSSPAPTIYTCVMHTEVQQSAPGKCPKCGMTLVNKESAAP